MKKANIGEIVKIVQKMVLESGQAIEKELHSLFDQRNEKVVELFNLQMANFNTVCKNFTENAQHQLQEIANLSNRVNESSKAVVTEQVPQLIAGLETKILQGKNLSSRSLAF